MIDKKTILLTGATGFLGSYLLAALLEKKYNVIILKRTTSDVWRISHLLERVEIYDIDIQPVALAFKENIIDIVIHTACHYGRNNDSLAQIVQSNLMFGVDLLDACLRYKVPVFINTDTFLQKNINSYALSKKQFVDWLQFQSKSIKIINLKIEHMYGPKDDSKKLVSWFLSQLKINAPEIKLTKGEQLRDFIYIDDVVSAFLIMIEKASVLADYSEFDVGSGELIKLRSFLEALKAAYVGFFGESNTELAFGSIPYREGEVMVVKLDNSPLIKLGWDTRWSVEKGLKEILKDIR